MLNERLLFKWDDEQKQTEIVLYKQEATVYLYDDGTYKIYMLPKELTEITRRAQPCR
ncbi:hypothetical protein [Desulfosporosinus sp. Sb-LF]|uniref:hypothetical protein n=1 Tax=Desulfosporosinus sp. Sb-LF TaxID=2560027 RepID=UPI0013050DFC|nr:hypothetical protein [Desulfosporosinus sp. Sb-LF]